VGSFDSLSSLHPGIAEAGNQAERAAEANDAKISMFQMREFLETALDFIEAEEDIEEIGRDGDNDERINRLKDHGVTISEREVDALHEVRLRGNWATHASKNKHRITMEEAENGLREAKVIRDWLEKTYSTSAIEGFPAIPPTPATYRTDTYFSANPVLTADPVRSASPKPPTASSTSGLKIERDFATQQFVTPPPSSSAPASSGSTLFIVVGVLVVLVVVIMFVKPSSQSTSHTITQPPQTQQSRCYDRALADRIKQTSVAEAKAYVIECQRLQAPYFLDVAKAIEARMFNEVRSCFANTCTPSTCLFDYEREFSVGGRMEMLRADARAIPNSPRCRPQPPPQIINEVICPNPNARIIWKCPAGMRCSPGGGCTR
jgi:hypothetical protein